MKRLQVIIAVLLLILLAQSATIIALYSQLGERTTGRHQYVETNLQLITFPFGKFNQPISNDTDYHLRPIYNSSWSLTVRSSLVASPADRVSEAQVAVAPEYKSENLSIPTIIVQERADGLLRVEYFAQDWKNTYGLVLYNSSSPGWSVGQNLTFKFIRFGPPAQVNPQLAPRPNGNLTIAIGGITVVSDYPIAWANLGAVYLYGYPGSSFRSGSLSLTFGSLEPAK